MLNPISTSSEKTLPSPAAWDDQLLADPHHVADKRRRVREMFAAIAPSYDLNNRLHSLGVDQLWRRKAVKQIAALKPSDHVVDVACGTGDLTLLFAAWLDYLNGGASGQVTPSQVIGVDFTFEMLPFARHKLDGRSNRKAFSVDTFNEYRRAINWINGDAQSLPLPNNCCDVVSIAFGIRNVQDPLTAFREFRRILRPGGRVIVLEFSLPTNPILRGLYNGYFRHVLPRTATLVSGDKTGAYKYLPESVNTFIGREQMVDMLTAAGFGQVEQFPMTFGVCVCYRGVVPG